MGNAAGAAHCQSKIVNCKWLRPFGFEYAYAPGWNWMERLYIRTFGFVDLPGRLRARIVIHRLRAMEWKSLLDLACGTGAYSLFFSRRQDAKVCGIDIDSSRIQDCRAAAQVVGRGNVRFIASRIERELPCFSAGSFDLVLAIEALQYLPDLESSLNEIYRILKPGGFLVAHLPAFGSLRRFENTLFDTPAIQRSLEHAGFAIPEVRATFGRFPTALCRIYGRLSRSRLLTALVFPLLMLSSLAWPIASGKGNYRLIIAQKSLP
jgi:SAM-dependent methyltransferase